MRKERNEREWRQARLYAWKMHHRVGDPDAISQLKEELEQESPEVRALVTSMMTDITEAADRLKCVLPQMYPGVKTVSDLLRLAAERGDRQTIDDLRLVFPPEYAASIRH